MTSSGRWTMASCFASLALAASLLAQHDELAKTEIKVVPVADGIAMLAGRGGNIGVVYGSDGIALIDDQYAPLSEKIVAAVKTLSDRPIRFVLNTHWHGDHTGGNEAFSGKGALVIAHDSVRKRMSVEQFNELWKNTTPPSPKAALPLVTFGATVTLHLGAHEIHAEHRPAAHTDGDAVVWLRAANVVHAGDLFFNGLYPFIDQSTGGTFSGYLAAIDDLLAKADAQTKIIPGHGPLAGRADLAAFRAMLSGVRDAMLPLVAAGRTGEQVVAAKPTAQWDGVWGGGFLDPPTFTKMVYELLKAERPGAAVKTGA